MNCIYELSTFSPDFIRAITLTQQKVKRNVDPENRKAEHWGYHAPHRSWYSILHTLSEQRRQLIMLLPCT